MSTQSTTGHTFEYSSVATCDVALTLATRIVFDRISELPKMDRDDLLELLRIYADAPVGSEERASAEVEMREILDPPAMKIIPLPSMKETGDNEPASDWSRDVGASIKRHRESKGWNQSQLAERAGLSSQSYVSRLESGAHSPSSLTVKRIADALEVAPSTLDPCFMEDRDE